MDNQRINNFLKFLAELYSASPTYDFDYHAIYDQLIFFDVADKDKTVNLSRKPSPDYPNYNKNLEAIDPLCHPNSPFNNWIQYYSNSPQTSCFVSPYWQYFCQFVSKDNQARLATEHIKIYIPLDAEHIEYGATLIFDFLEKNHISHQSKIGQEIRFDDIVVRLINPEDADKLLQFVTSHPYLKEGLIKPNPFAFQQNGIAMAVDGHLSFNATLSKLLKAYMDEKRNSNTLDQVDADDFYNFVRKLYMDQFIYRRNDDLLSHMRWRNKEEEKNYREVISLIIKVHNPSFTYLDYKQHYATCANIELLTEQNVIDANRLLIEALQAMTKRWNRNGMQSVKSYIEEGDPFYITSRNDLRSRIVNSKFRETIQMILYQRKMTFEQYAQALLDQYHIDLDQLIVDTGLGTGSGPGQH